MDALSIIPTIAEIAITLVGFSAIVVVLNPQPFRDWGRVEKLNFRILIQVSAIAIIFSILPFATHTLFEPNRAWNYALLIYGFLHLVDILSFLPKFPKGAPKTNLVLAGAGGLVVLAQLSVGFIGTSKIIQVTYLASLTWHLFVAFIAFINLVYGSGRQNAA